MNILISLYITITNFKNRRLVLLVDLNSFLSLPENPWKNVVSSGKVVKSAGRRQQSARIF